MSDMGYKPCKNQQIVEEFAKMNADCARIDGWPHKTAQGCAQAINQTIKKMGKKGVYHCTVKDGKVYLVRM